MASPASSATLSIHSSQIDDSDDAMSISSLDDPVIDPVIDLPEEYIHSVPETFLSPSMKAASNPDFKTLKTILSHGHDLRRRRWCAEREMNSNYHPSSDILDWHEFSHLALRSKGRSVLGITTPLMEAIRAQLPANIRILLQAGATPNGVPYELLDDYAALFLRFRPSIRPLFDGSPDVASRYVFLTHMNLPQISSLTCEEVEDRFEDGMAPFWCEEGFTQAFFWTNGESMHSLIEAAKCGSIEIFEMLLGAGADTSFWRRPQFCVPEPATESSLAVSSPLHAAIEARNAGMVEYLLGKGFDPNTMPLVNPTRCVTPLMSTIVHCSSFNKEAFDILSQAPNISFEIRTPVYGVHLLHFAIARLDLELLKHVVERTPLANAGETALGHTLLHVACMPANASQVQRYAGSICRSIHETRDLRPFNDTHALRAGSPFCVEGKHFKAQAEVVKYLWESGITNIERRDIHGNTALHYLAGSRFVNQDLLDWWFEVGGSHVVDLWHEGYNDHGVAPGRLEAAGKEVRMAKTDTLESQLERYYSDERAKKKEEIWKGLLQM